MVKLFTYIHTYIYNEGRFAVVEHKGPSLKLLGGKRTERVKME